MADLSLEWGGDFQVSASGDLLLADQDTLARQRIIRSLCTAVQGYVWHPEYGAGLPQQVGMPGSSSAIQALVAAQIALNPAVAPNPPPTVAVTAGIPAGVFVITIGYTSANTGQAVYLSFNSATGQPVLSLPHQ